MSIVYQQMFVGQNLQALIELTDVFFGHADALLDELSALPGVPVALRTAMAKPTTMNALAGLAPIEYLAGGLLKHSAAHPTPQILADWALGTSATPMRINRIRMLADVFFST